MRSMTFPVLLLRLLLIHTLFFVRGDEGAEGDEEHITVCGCRAGLPSKDGPCFLMGMQMGHDISFTIMINGKMNVIVEGVVLEH